MTAPLFENVDCLALPVPDLDAAIAFYGALGHRVIWRTSSAAGLALAGSPAELVLQTERSTAEADLKVRSVDDAVAAFTAAGGRVVHGPFAIAIGRGAVVADPWDNTLVLLDNSTGHLVTDADGHVTDVASAGPFSVSDLDTATALVASAWASALDRDWSVPAGTLDWSCWQTADHTVDCVFSYALFLASRRLDSYPPFDLLRALPEATPADLIEGLEATTRMLTALIVTAPPGTRAVLTRKGDGPPADFAPRAAHEIVLHGFDVCRGLGVEFEPPADLCARLLAHTRGWYADDEPAESDDPWCDLLVRSGRTL